MLTTAEFRQLVEQSSDVVARSTDDLAAIYQIVGLPAASLSFSRKAAIDHAASQLRTHCPRDLRPIQHWMRKLKHGLIGEFVITDAPLHPSFAVASAIFDTVRPRQDNGPHTANPEWPAIVHWGRILADLAPQTYQLPDHVLRGLHSRAFTVAEASRRLRNTGFSCTIENGVARFDEAERKRIVATLDEFIARLGGAAVADRIFADLAPEHFPEMQRYLLGRRWDVAAAGSSPELPVGLLVQLCVKHLDEAPGSRPFDEDAWKSLCTLATDVAAHYDVQPHSPFELEFKDHQTLVEFIQELALYDRFFGLRQFRPGDVPDAILGLFDWLSAEHEQHLGWPIRAVTAVATAIFAAASRSYGPAILDPAAIIAQCPSIPAEQATAILRLFTHEHSPNPKFVLLSVGKIKEGFRAISARAG